MEYRAYFFGNMYLSSIQQGIQAAHVVGEMSVKYYAAMDGGDPDGETFYQWATHDKTMVLLNAGYSEEIHSLVQMFSRKGNSFPWAKFHEDEDALDGALTCVGIILPEYIWEGARQLRESPRAGAQLSMRESGHVEWSPGGNTSKPLERQDITKWEFELICRLNTYGLAR